MADRRRWLVWGGGGIALVLAGAALWLGYGVWQSPQTDADAPVKTTGTTILDQADVGGGVATVDVAQNADTVRGTTPMAARVAILGLLNKRNGAPRDLTMKPGEAVRVGNAVVRLRACERTAPWETDQFTGAFVQLDVMQPDRKWRRSFSGWLFKERPALNVVLDPVYDVWPKSCAMSFPSGGAATVSIADRPTVSSAKKSPAASDDGGDAEEGEAAEAPPAAPPAAPRAPATTPSTAADNRPR